MGSFAVTIAISVGMLGIISVVSVAAVNVCIGVHVDAVEDDVCLGKTILANGLMEHFETLACGVAGTCNINLDIGVWSDQMCV